ncbi:hypothetical protein [Nocardia brasiliensis]|uniref:hypothetical protein n=1 Tax=Nocardia brasiliensis TaxID=37326 RepID=UPI00366F9A0F
MTSSTRIGDIGRGNSRLARELTALRRSVDAGISELAKVSDGGSPDERLSENTVRNIEDGKNVFEVSVSKYVRACRRIAEAKHKRIDSNRFDAGYWRRLWQDGEKAPAFAEWVTDHTPTARRGAETGRTVQMPPRGQDLDDVDDPFGVGVDVHRSITVDPARERDPLPPYVRRDHDDELGERIEAARRGRSGMAVLVAGSSTGKTRALWEALAALRKDGGWRWWHPDESADPDAVQAVESVGPHTVVWLNETQNYLGHNVSGDPQRLARRLRELLADPLRAPVLVLGTLWRDHCNTLCRDHTSQVAKLLEGTLIRVPENFVGKDLAAMRAAATDPRLSEACERAEGGQITQYLAGGPELIARYESAPPATRAVIEVAMDAVRLGHRNILPHSLLHDAAAARMSDSSWDGLAENWFPLVLAEVGEPCKGARGPITPIRDRPLPSRTDRRTGHTADRRGRPGPGTPVYQLADFLDQYGRRERANTIPPIGFWEAAAAHARPGDQHALAQAAWARGLYRDAAQLWKNAADHGHTTAATELVTRLHTVFPDDRRPAAWAAGHAALNETVAVAKLMWQLRKLGADDQARTLAARAAAHVPLDNPGAVADLLRSLRKLGADDQVQALVARDPGAQAALDKPQAVAVLLAELRELGADDQVQALAVRAAAHVAHDDPWAVARLLRELRRSGADDQVHALAARATAHAAREKTDAVARVLWELRRSGVGDQVHALATWAAAHAVHDDPGAVASLLRALRELGADDQVQTLLARDPAVHVTLDKPRAVADLLRELRALCAGDQSRALLARDPAAHVALDDPIAVAALAGELRALGMDDQVRTLAARAAAEHDPVVLGWLLRELRNSGAGEQVQALLARDPAAHVPLDNPQAVADLLAELRELGADDQVQTLAVRAAAHTAHDNPVAMARQLWELRAADHQLRALAAQAAAHAPRDDPVVVAWLLRQLRKSGAGDQIQALLARDPAAHVPLDKPRAVADLLRELRELGADDQANVLSDRLPASGLFALFLSLSGRAEQFRFGREPDGARAEQWRWEDLQ